MDKYIKLSQALEVLDSCSCWWAHERMERVPAADAVEVVRCKDCMMANACSDDREMYCTLNHCYKEKNYFCADGKKKEES